MFIHVITCMRFISMAMCVGGESTVGKGVAIVSPAVSNVFTLCHLLWSLSVWLASGVGGAYSEVGGV